MGGQRYRPFFDHFGWVAPIYERVIRPPDAERLHHLLDLGDDDCLLDVGGGTGRVAKFLGSSICPVCVLDVSYGMLQQTDGRRGLVPVQGAVERMPFADGAFSRILAVDSFHHFADQVEAAGEMLRVLAPGGRLVVEEPDIRRLSVKFVALGERLALMRSHFRRPAYLSQLFSKGRTEVDLVEGGPNFWLIVNKPS